jgi:hypothetical protein
MKTDSPGQEAPRKAGLQKPPAARLVQAVEPQAAVLDVMVEQIEYLAAHAAGTCNTECADCARLEQVKHWLLAPFR